MSAAAGARRRGAGALVAVVVLLVLAGLVGVLDDPQPRDGESVTADGTTSRLPRDPVGAPTQPSTQPPTQTPPPTGAPAADPPQGAPSPPPPPPADGGIFGDNRTLVAFYGTAGTGALGVLGEGRPGTVIGRLARAAAAFERPGRPVQVVFELIVTIADATPGPDGDFNHDIARADVERYVRAARRHDVLLVLDLQPGRASFPEVARRWAWALRDPLVGLALDPEWRMGRGEVPGRVIGSVDAAEVNATSRWLVELQVRHALPQKLFVLHQFRTDMIERIGRIVARPRLATVQHVDGFGTPDQKLETYRTVLQPQQFHPGFKLFYDEDVRLMRPADVLRIRPQVRFVSYQ